MNEIRPVSLIKAAYYLPEKVLTNDFFIDPESEEDGLHLMFTGVDQRRHASETETSVYMINQAVNTLVGDLNLDLQRDVDMLLTNISLPEGGFMGSGAILAKKLGTRPKFIFDFHHSGCVSFITMLDLAKTYIEHGRADSALICNVQNSAFLFAQEEVRKKPHAGVPGDGCGVAYVKVGQENPILSIVQQCHPESSEGMHWACTDTQRKYLWQPSMGELYVDFDETKIAKVLDAGNRIVPEAMFSVCKEVGIAPSEIDFLITTQPSAIFLRNWREVLQISQDKHLDTFATLGNLFGAAIPVNLTEAIAQKKLNQGDKVMLAGFSHAGDFSGAAIIDWQTNL